MTPKGTVNVPLVVRIPVPAERFIAPTIKSPKKVRPVTFNEPEVMVETAGYVQVGLTHSPDWYKFTAVPPIISVAAQFNVADAVPALNTKPPPGVRVQ